MALRPLEPESLDMGLCNSFKILGDALPVVFSKDSFFIALGQNSLDSAILWSQI